MSLFKELHQLMAKYRFKPKKSLGQNFIVNQDVIDVLVEEADLKKTDVVLEIGAGTGFLTRELLKHCKVVAIEKDDVLAELLEKELPSKNLELIHGDFFEIELPKFNKIVTLPPYNVSKKVISKINTLNFEVAVLVLQKEFAEKIAALPGFAE